MALGKSLTGKKAVLSLYRSALRQVRLLPHNYLRQYFRIKFADDARRILETWENEGLRYYKIKRVRKEVTKLERANAGDRHYLLRAMNFAYGRSGPMKYAIIEPLLSNPGADAPPRIISSLEHSRPPVFSPELSALLISSQSRLANKALAPADLVRPPLLPPQADPKSTEARLFGPLSKLREVNIRQRFFKTQWKTILPPLEVTVRTGGQGSTTDWDDVKRAGIRGVGLQGAGVFRELQILAGPVGQSPPKPRRQRQTINGLESDNDSPPEPTTPPAPNRYLRRRYREFLRSIPILKYTPPADKSASEPNRKGRYHVALAPNLLSTNSRAPHSLPEADAVDIAWLERGRPHKHSAKITPQSK